MIEFTEVTEEHLRTVAQNMRDADIEEVWAATRHTPLQALTDGVMKSEHSVTVKWGGEAVAVYGLRAGAALSGIGVPWMLTAGGILNCRRELMTHTPVVLGKMLLKCGLLENQVHVENKVSIGWLSRMGFTIDSPEPTGVEGGMFHRFHMGAADV